MRKINHIVRIVIVFAALTAFTSANGAELKFRPAPGAEPVIGRYLVTIDDAVAVEIAHDSAEALARAYGGQLEPYSSSNTRQFAIAMLPNRARTLSTDPRVREVVEVAHSETDDALSPNGGAPPSASTLTRHLTPSILESSSSGTYVYDGAGNITTIGADSFVYDLDGRLTQATVQGSQQSYTYDAYGNRTGASRAAGAASCIGGCEATVTVIPATNHLAEQTYYDDGSVKTGYGATYTYDGTGMVMSATVGSDVRIFVYTADDERIAVRRGLSWTWTVRDQGNKVLREFTSLENSPSPLSLTAHTWSKDYVWRDGLLLASLSGSPTLTTYHYHLDHLGTPRLITGTGGSLIAKHTYYPFGAEMSLTPPENAVELMKFTGHERDIVAADNASVDYMHARMYNGNLGRFLSVDSEFGHLDEPQSLNRYAYVTNDPINASDPNGRERLRKAMPRPKLEPGAVKAAAHKVDKAITEGGQVATDAVFILGVLTSMSETGDEELLQPAVEKLEADASTVVEELETEGPTLFRGGSSTQVRDSEMKIRDGLVQPKSGLSVNTDPAQAAKHGAPHKVESIPEGLTVIQTGKDLGHHEIVPSAPITKEQFFELLGQIVLSRM